MRWVIAEAVLVLASDRASFITGEVLLVVFYGHRDDGSNLRRLTSSYSIESTPEWSPNGRQISFTSGRSGTPQIYVMDADGGDVHRIPGLGDVAWQALPS